MANQKVLFGADCKAQCQGFDGLKLELPDYFSQRHIRLFGTLQIVAKRGEQALSAIYTTPGNIPQPILHTLIEGFTRACQPGKSAENEGEGVQLVFSN